MNNNMKQGVEITKRPRRYLTTAQRTKSGSQVDTPDGAFFTVAYQITIYYKV